MKVLCNGLFLTRPNTGIGQYTRLLLPELAKAMPKDELMVAVPERIRGLKLKQVVIPVSRSVFGYGVALNSWERHTIARATDEQKADLILTTYPTSPVATDRPVVMTVHDLIPWQDPAYRSTLRSRRKLALVKRGIHSAQHLLTVSETSKRALVEKFNTSRVTVTYEDIDPALRKPAAKAAVAKARKKYGLDRPYSIYVGGFDARKNTRLLPEILASSHLAPTHDLVALGEPGLPAKLYRDYLAVRTDPNIRTTGFVSEADKHALLTGADALIYPSRLEGFGLPVLEALAVGTPVAAGDSEAIHELFQPAVRLADANDPIALGAALAAAVTKPFPKAAASQILRRYSWSKTAKLTAAVLHDVAQV